MGAVFLCRQTNGSGLDPHRQVFADDDDVVPLSCQIVRYREDAGVVVPELETAGQHGGVTVIQLNAHRATRSADGQRRVQASVLNAKVI